MAEYFDYLDKLELVEGLINRDRIIRDRSNPFEKYDDAGFIFRFRFPKHMVLDILELVKERLQPIQVKISTIPPVIQLLISLQFYGSGTLLRNDADLFGIHTSTVSRILPQCSRALASLYNEFIYFPDYQEHRKIQEDFHAVAGLPGVVGVIDCTHVPIRSPGGEQAEIFRNRKGFFSINVQAIGDAQLKIRNLVVRWPGSVHDSRIFDNSEIGAKFENGEINGLLLGDSGYALRQYLITPILQPQTRAERRFNYAHCSTRVKIENVFGVWKRRFQCLSRTLAIKLDTSLAVIVACGVLHNIARTYNLPEFEDVHEAYLQEPEQPIQNPNQGGRAQRAQLVRLFE